MANSNKNALDVEEEFNWSETLPSIAIINAIAVLENVDALDAMKAC